MRRPGFGLLHRSADIVVILSPLVALHNTFRFASCSAAYLAVALSDSRRYPEAQAAFELVETSIANNPDHELDASFLLWLRSNHAKTFDWSDASGML